MQLDLMNDLLWESEPQQQLLCGADEDTCKARCLILEKEKANASPCSFLISSEMV